eukprot:3154893-Alexandrium_andersonii.AAC.1
MRHGFSGRAFGVQPCPRVCSLVWRAPPLGALLPARVYQTPNCCCCSSDFVACVVARGVLRAMPLRPLGTHTCAQTGSAARLRQRACSPSLVP